MTTARNTEIDRMALAHACIMPPFLGEKPKRRMTTTTTTRGGGEGGGECARSRAPPRSLGGSEQEAEKEEDAGGLETSPGQSNGNFFRVCRSLCISLSLSLFPLVPRRRAFFPRTRFTLSAPLGSFRAARVSSNVYYNRSRGGSSRRIADDTLFL